MRQLTGQQRIRQLLFRMEAKASFGLNLRAIGTDDQLDRFGRMLREPLPENAASPG